MKKNVNVVLFSGIILIAFILIFAGCKNGITEHRAAEENLFTDGVWYNATEFKAYQNEIKTAPAEPIIAHKAPIADAGEDPLAYTGEDAFEAETTGEETRDMIEEDLVVTWAYILNDTGNIGIVLLEPR